MYDENYEEGYEVTILIKNRDTGDETCVKRTIEDVTWTPLLHAFAEALNGSGFIDVKNRIGVLQGLTEAHDDNPSWIVLSEAY